VGPPPRPNGVTLAHEVIRRGRLVGGLAVVLAAMWSGAPLVSRAASGEVVFVANADSGPVTAYPASSSGGVSPTMTLTNPNLVGTVWDPWGVAVDADGSVLVQTFLSNATTFVFQGGTQAATAPTRVFRGGGPDSRAIAVDASGYEYVATGESSAQILVLAPAAAGRPSELYSVAPLRTIVTDESLWYPWPSMLTSDAAGNVIAAVTRSQGNAIEVFGGGPLGGDAPNRVITGPHTGLGRTPDHLVVTYSPYTGRLYVAVSADTNTHISAFTGDAIGDADPIRTITGPATGLDGRVITGIADSQVSGDIYVMVKDAQFGSSGQVEVFGRLADGDTPPVRIFTDVATSFADAAGIAIVKLS